MRRLLIMACSKRKLLNKGALTAVERYDGVLYRVLDVARRRCPDLLTQHMDLLILSAESGLVPWWWPMHYYDRKMTRARALELRSKAHLNLRAYVAERQPADIFVCLGRTYRLAIDGALDDADARVTYASGGIGSHMQQLKRWLEDA